MSSGVKLSDDAFTRFNDMKMKKKARFMMMEIRDAFIYEKLTVGKSDDQESDYKDFLDHLPEKQCRFIILDMYCPSKSGHGGKDNLFAIAWCPDNAPVAEKMLYASTRQAFLDKIKEGTKNLQANDLTDLVYEDLLAM